MSEIGVGTTPTEKYLHSLCQKTFLSLWSYPNPYKDDGKEFCDLIAIFEDRVYIFFDRYSRKFENDNSIELNWKRWKKETIDKQISTANGAERYLLNRRELFLDDKLTIDFPIQIPENAKIHKIIIAHGAAEACKAFSDDNITGSLAICYSKDPFPNPFPFSISLNSKDRVHVFDSHNVPILFGELDTFFDFSKYIEEKERAIDKYEVLMHCGEEDLLAHYFLNFDKDENSYRIGPKESGVNNLIIGEGEWDEFSNSDPYRRRKKENLGSYLWDKLIERSCEFHLNKETRGNANIIKTENAIKEMAREPRFMRRANSEAMIQSIKKFVCSPFPNSFNRQMNAFPSYYEGQRYVFLQLEPNYAIDYDTKYREIRQRILKIACGVTKNKYPHLKKIIGIAIDAPNCAKGNSEDFLLLNCEVWPKDMQIFFEEENKIMQFYETEEINIQFKKSTDFPLKNKNLGILNKIGRNSPCPCGSKIKFKKCCGKFRQKIL